MGEVHHFDAGDLGCATGLPKQFLARIRAIPVGDVLRTVVADPSAREDLPALARMLGQSVRSIESEADGRLAITVERVK
jgi:TusA-related sulfurtransferase